ncbi:MAG: hypothetical protein R3C61_07100 [Bacteroidia bacterium]
MARKKMADYTVEELKGQKKVILSIMGIMVGLILAFAVYFIYSLTAGTWKSTNTLGLTSVGMLVAVLSTQMVVLTTINAELKKRGIS